MTRRYILWIKGEPLTSFNSTDEAAAYIQAGDEYTILDTVTGATLDNHGLKITTVPEVLRT